MISALLALLLFQAAPYGTVGPPGPASYRSGTSSDTPDYAIAPQPITPAPELARTGVTIDAYDRRVESRWAPDDPFYAGTVRGGAAIAQSRQGQLDGGWAVAGPDGQLLYGLQLVDAGEGWLEGAWRRLGPDEQGRPSASGFIALIGREAGRVTLRFLEPGSPAPTALSLEMAGDGSWRGEARRGGGSATPVRMVRR